MLWDLHTGNRMVVGCTYPIWCPHYPPMTSPYSRVHSVSFTTTTSTQRSLTLVTQATVKPFDMTGLYFTMDAGASLLTGMTYD
jgi:hypothetical protein